MGNRKIGAAKTGRRKGDPDCVRSLLSPSLRASIGGIAVGVGNSRKNDVSSVNCKVVGLQLVRIVLSEHSGDL